MKPINENTAISIGLMITLAGAVFWVSTIYSLASSTETRTSKIEQKQDRYIEDMHQIKEDVAVIKQMLIKSK